jgi:uncharacterized repeat protein (TIGR01451 family)
MSRLEHGRRWRAAKTLIRVMAGHGLWAILCFIVICCGASTLEAQTELRARAVITVPINEAQRIRLSGNTRPEANRQNDRGRLPDTRVLEHLQLLLGRPPEREAALQDYIARIHAPRSSDYHHWLTPAELAQRFGPAQADIDAVTQWLRARGFTVNVIYGASPQIDFSGTAGQVRAAFGCEIHALSVRGVAHIANMSDPQIPAALAPVVRGIVSLHDFAPRPLLRPRAQYSTSGGQHLLAPADLSVIYNFNPVFAAGNTGQNQTIVVLEDTDVFSASDWSTFRSTFNLTAFSGGSFSQVHPAPPSGHSNCADPGVVGGGRDAEATLDAEWASAAAPSAAIEVAACADTTTFGVLIALQNLLNSTSPPAIVSLSYLECEAANGAAANAAFNSVYATAAAEGVSVFVASGDEGAAGCDPNVSDATHGIGVNALASTPNDVAVGGTDFGDTYAGSAATYWSSSNTASFGSALSYVPEIPWNNSCAGSLLANFLGYGVSYGSGGLCNSSLATVYLTTSAGSGGPSRCATGSAAQSGVVGGSCAGYAKPSWQSGPGVPADGLRDLPDVALFAGNGLWDHYYVYCWSDTAAGGKACTGAPSTWSGAGGTSFAAPVLAGIQALVNASLGGRQGNPNYVYYALAASQRGAGLNCNATAGNATAAQCVFYDVTQGDIDVDCRGANSCYLPSGTYGVLSTSSGTDAAAYAAAVGWDSASGNGSINAKNLIGAWKSADVSITGSSSINGAGQTSLTLNVGNSGPQPAAAVTVTATLPSGAALVTGSSSASCAQSGQTLSCSVGSLGVNGTATLVVVIQPGGAGNAGVSFNVSESNGDLDLANNLYAATLGGPAGNGSVTDGPLPPWSGFALAAALFGLIALRTRAT